jgi:hypothetical protein
MSPRPNFAVDQAGAATVVRKPKVVSAHTWQERARNRRLRAWEKRMKTRIDQATSIEEVMQLMREPEFLEGL